MSNGITLDTINTLILFFNAISIGLIVITLVFIQEQWLLGKRIVSTIHDKFVLVLIIISLFESLSNLFLPSNGEECFYSIVISHILIHCSVLTFNFICLLMLSIALTDRLHHNFAKFSMIVYVSTISLFLFLLNQIFPLTRQTNRASFFY